MRNVLERVNERVKADAQAIYHNENHQSTRAASGLCRFHFRSIYSAVVKRLERDIPELVSFFSFPLTLAQKLGGMNVIEGCFTEMRRRTYSTACFVNVASADRIIGAIFSGVNEKPQFKNRTSNLLRKQLDGFRSEAEISIVTAQ